MPVPGLENYPVVLGDLSLPPLARLQVIQATDVQLSPQQLTTLVEVPAGTSGVLLSVKLDSTSKDYNYLEACMRIYLDQAQEPLFLSSGAEDYFNSVRACWPLVTKPTLCAAKALTLTFPYCGL